MLFRPLTKPLSSPVFNAVAVLEGPQVQVNVVISNGELVVSSNQIVVSN